MAQVLCDGLEADCGELIRLQDVIGLTVRNARICVQDDGIRLDGCREILFDQVTIEKRD